MISLKTDGVHSFYCSALACAFVSRGRSRQFISYKRNWESCCNFAELFLCILESGIWIIKSMKAMVVWVTPTKKCTIRVCVWVETKMIIWVCLWNTSCKNFFFSSIYWRHCQYTLSGLVPPFFRRTVLFFFIIQTHQNLPKSTLS